MTDDDASLLSAAAPPAPAAPVAPVAVSAVLAISFAAVALLTVGFGAISLCFAGPAVALGLGARAQLKHSGARGWTLSLVAFLIGLGVLVWVGVPIVAPWVIVAIATTLP